MLGGNKYLANMQSPGIAHAMMKKSPFINFILLFVLFSLLASGFTAQAQKRKLRKADRQFSLFQFDKAINIYNKVLKKDSSHYEGLSQLANIYRITGDYQQAEKNYARVVQTGKADSIQIFHYAQMLRCNEKYEEAKAYYLKYAELAPEDNRGARLAAGIDSLPALKADSLKYRVLKFPQNSNVSDFSPAFYENGIVFPSARGIGNIDVWSGSPFLDLYVAEGSDTSFANPKPLPGSVNQQYHEGPATFDSSFTVMYFTRNNYVKKRKRKKGDERIMKIKIFKSVRDNDRWPVTGELPFNSDHYSAGHPTLSRDGKYLYFASDMPHPDAVGGQDLYVVEITDSGMTDPVNLGPGINTKGDEVFPFIHNSGDTLFFASDSYLGFGGLDIYAATKTNGKWTQVRNMGYPLNTSGDDFGLIMQSKIKEGYFASNRPGGMGDDDIYYFDDRVKVVLVGKVIDKKTGEEIPEAMVRLQEIVTASVDSLLTDENGKFSFKLTLKRDYEVTSEKYGYFLISPVNVSTQQRIADTIKVTLEMQRIGVGEIIKLENIYYDFDKYDIRPDAAVELNRFVKFMNQYEDLVVELRSHTDSRGSDNYNMWLSTKRAESAVNYVISKGIGTDRITFKGFGESLPVNECVNDVPCTEEQHQLNRRTEFMVVKQPKGLKVKSSATD